MFAGMLGTCTNPFIGGLSTLGTGTTEIAKIGTGLQTFIDGLLGPLLSGALTNLTPQAILDLLDSIRTAILDNPLVAGIIDLIGGLSGDGLLNDIVTGFNQFITTLFGGLGFSTWSDIVTTITDTFDWLFNQLGMSIESVFKPIAEFLNWLFTGLVTGAPPPTTGNAAADALLQPLFGFLKWAWDLFGSAVNTVLKPLFTFLHWLFDGFATGAAAPTTGNAAADSLLQPLFGFLRWLWTSFGATVETVLKPIFVFLNWLFTGLATGATPPTTGNAVADSLLQPVFALIKTVWDLFGGIAGGAAATLTNIFAALQKVLDANGDLSTWINNIPLIGPLVKYLTVNIPNIEFTPDLAGLGQWANQLLHAGSNLPAGNLFGEIPKGLLAMIPVANINIDSANLLGQGAFATAGTIDAAEGWEWDGTTNDPAGESSGSAKLTTSGAARYLYARQAIKVAAGDKIKLSARIKTASYTGSGTSIVLSVIPYIGTTAQTEKVFATRGASNGAWVTMTGTATDVNPYIVPAGVTSLIVKVGVTAASGTGSTVWIDNVDMRKEGLLGQNLVEYLLNAWENMWSGLVGTSGAGKTWADMFDAAKFLRLFANGTNVDLGTLSGNLLSAPASVLGSLFSVVFDGTKTVGDFLRLLYNALNKSTSSTPKSADDVANAAGATRDVADAATVTANGAAGTANSAATAASAATTAANAATTAAASATTGVSRLYTTTIAGYTVDTYYTGTATWNKPTGLSQLYVACFGGGGKGQDYPSGDGGIGGTGGGFVAQQIDVSAVPSSVALTIGAASSTTSATATTFGSLLSSEGGLRGYVASPLGMLATASQPGSGGKGGYGGGFGLSGQSTANGAVTGGAGGTYGPGGNGMAGTSFGLAYTGGGGGGGGMGSPVSSQCKGGNGGFPGGGGGGGGSTVGTTGPGGSGANGLMIVIYKTVSTT